jgi:hypothetical protein
MKTILNKIYPFTNFNIGHQLEFDYHFKNNASISNKWIEDWVNQVISLEKTDWNDKDVLPFALYLKNNIEGQTWNSILNITQIGNAICSSETIEISKLDYKHHVSEPLIKLGKKSGLPKKMVTQIIIWIWS